MNDVIDSTLTPAAAGLTPSDLRPSGLRRRHLRTERVARTLLLCGALLSIVTTVGIVLSLLVPTIEFFGVVNVGDFFGGTTWAPLFKPARFGVWPIIVGTLWVTAIAITVAVPCGLLAAVYLSEYARPGVRKLVKPVLELLAGIPTVVFGFFALTFINPSIVKRWWPFGDVGAYSALGAGLITGIMILPIVASLSEDAMAAVPQALRQGAYALGSTKREVCTKVVFRAALSGIVAAVVLAISRAFGETMIAVLAAGSKAELSANPGRGMETMTGFIGAAGQGDLPTGSIGYQTIFAVGFVLFMITFVLNLLSARIVRKYREVYE